MSKRIRSYRIAFSALILCLSVAALGAQAGAVQKPWYADGLMKLGFTVFQKTEVPDDASFQALDGPAVKLSEQKGKIVILNFWATWCPPCRAEMPAIDRLWNKNKDKAFTIMGVSVGEKPEVVRDFIAKNGYGYPIFVDPSGELGSAFNARSIPTTYILDKSGAVIAGKVGGAAYDSPEAVALFAQLASR